MPDLNIINHPLTGTPFGTALDLCLVLAAALWSDAVTRDLLWVDRSVAARRSMCWVPPPRDFASPREYHGALHALGARLTVQFRAQGGYSSGAKTTGALLRERYSISSQLVKISYPFSQCC